MKAGSSGDEWLFHTTHFITLDQPFFFTRINGFMSLSKCHSVPAPFPGAQSLFEEDSPVWQADEDMRHQFLNMRMKGRRPGRG
jgi:hypothetical protein